MIPETSTSTRDILRASAIIGSGSGISIVAGIVKTKVIAVLLGPSGVGLFGLLNSLLSTACVIAGVGISNSGIRKIAEENAKGIEGVRRTRAALNFSSIGLGFLGALAVVVLREPLGDLVRDKWELSGTIAFIALGVWASTVLASQTAFLNGLRRLGDLSRLNIISSIVALIVAVLSVWLWQQEGVVVAVVGAPLSSLVISYWFTRKIETSSVRTPLADIGDILKELLALGIVFMASSLMFAGTQLAIRLIVTNELGMNATGHFQAASSISTLYLGFVLGAMGADYYPRLTAVSGDRLLMNRMVNEQAEVALLLSGPVILAMVTFAPWVVHLLYSDAFEETTTVLRWQLLGDIFRVASWSTGFILLAHGWGKIYFCSDLAANLVYVGVAWNGLRFYGVEATGMAFLLCYLFYFFLIWFIVGRMNGFAWARSTLLFMGVLLAACASIVLTRPLLPAGVFGLGLIMTLLFSSYSAYRLARSLGKPTLLGFLRRFKT